MRLKSFLVRRWYDFRYGHSMYLAFLLSFTNFILICYRLLIERIPALHLLMPELWTFAAIFLIVYPITASIVGWMHRRKIQPIESRVVGEVSSWGAMIWRTFIDYVLDPNNPVNRAKLEALRDRLKVIEERGK